MNPESRYVSVDTLFVPSHTYNDLGLADPADGSMPTVTSRLASYRLVTAQADPPPSTTRAKITSHMHLYAQDEFGDPEKWWIIADANPQIRYPLDLKPNDLVYLP